MNRDYPLAESPILGERKEFKAAKKLAKAKAKLDFREKVTDTKNEIGASKRVNRATIKEDRKEYKAAKKEIRKYKD
jgi:multidrug resistance efflux pump